MFLFEKIHKCIDNGTTKCILDLIGAHWRGEGMGGKGGALGMWSDFNKVLHCGR